MAFNALLECEPKGVWKENSLQIGVLEDTDKIDGIFQALSSIVKKTTYKLNRTCFGFNFIPFESVFVDHNMGTTQKDIDIFLIVLDTTAFNSFTNLTNTAWLDTADSFLISKPPNKYESSMYTFLACEELVQFIFLGTLVIFILVASLIYYVMHNEKRISFPRVFAQYTWKIFSPTVSKSMMGAESLKYCSLYLILGTWCFGTLVIGICVTSFLSSKLSVISYDTVDGIEDLVRMKNMEPVTLKYLSEHIHVQKKATKSENYRIVNDKLNKGGKETLINFLDLLMNPKLYEEIVLGKKALLMNKMLWSCIFHVSKELLDINQNPLLYYGTDSISSGVMTFYYNNTVSKIDQEITNAIILSMVEDQILNYYMFRNKYGIAQLTWFPDPLEDVTSTTFNDLKALFLVVHISHVVSFVVLAFEIHFDYLVQKLKKYFREQRFYRVNLNIFDY